MANPAEPHRPSSALLVLALGPAVAQGLGRFGYGLLLPAMRDDLGWSYAQAGFVNTANALGYLAGALIAPVVLARVDLRRALIGGMVAVAVSLMATAVARDFVMLSGLRVVAGLAGAIVFVAGGTLLAGADHGAGSRRGFHLAVYYAGVGFGLFLAALTLPPLLSAATWPWGWIVLGALALPLAALVARYSRSLHGAAQGARRRHAPVDWPSSGWLLLGYLCFGTGSIGYMTFITAALDSARGWWSVTLFWSVFFAGAAAAPVLWETALDHWRAGRTFLVVAGANALAGLIALAPAGSAAMLASAFLFGLTFFTVVAITTLHVARVAAADARAATIAAFTVMFAAGQAVGPLLTGWVSDLAGTLDAGLLAGAAITATGAVLGASGPRRAARGRE